MVTFAMWSEGHHINASLKGLLEEKSSSPITSEQMPQSWYIDRHSRQQIILCTLFLQLVAGPQTLSSMLRLIQKPALAQIRQLAGLCKGNLCSLFFPRL